MAVRFELFISVLLSDSSFPPFKFHLLLTLLFNHIICSLVQTHAALLCFKFILYETGQSLWTSSWYSGWCRTSTRHGVVFLAKLLYFCIVTLSPSYWWLVAAIDRPLAILTVLLVLLMVNIFLFHTYVMLLLHQRWLVTIKVALLRRWICFLVGVYCSRRVAHPVLDWVDWTV